jgi:hypothetical protein
MSKVRCHNLFRFNAATIFTRRFIAPLQRIQKFWRWWHSFLLFAPTVTVTGAVWVGKVNEKQVGLDLFQNLHRFVRNFQRIAADHLFGVKGVGLSELPQLAFC